MAHGMDHAAQRLGVRLLDGLADAAQANRPQRVPLAAVRAVRRLDLGDDERAHAVVASSSAGSSAGVSSAGGATASPLVEAAGLPLRPSTLSTDRPRSAATSSGLRRSCRPAM